MKTDYFHIDGPWQGRLAIVPRPRGGDWLENEVSAWRRSGHDVVVSLLTPEETADLDVARFEQLASGTGPENLEQAIALYRGDLLDGFSLKEEPFEDWLRAERELMAMKKSPRRRESH